MPNSKQRREAARRRLERQAERRHQREETRRRATLIATVVGTLVVLAVVIVATVMITDDNGNSTAAAPSTADTSASPTPSPSSTQTPLPARTPAKIAARAAKKTSGPCAYAENEAALTSGTVFDVGLPPDPSPTPITATTATFTTNLGPITVTMDAANAPCNVQSIDYLIKQKFYDNTACPRSVNEGIFVVQCGDPSATTGGGPTYTTKDENLAKANYVTGTLAMANSGANTNGSQFFFITKDSNATADGSGGLSKNYTVIGHVTGGLAILQKVASGGDDGSNSAGGGRPKIDLIFKTVTVK